MTATAKTPCRTQPLALAVAMLATALSLLAFSPSALSATTAGFQDFNFGVHPPAPTAKEPQSKLWFNDGIWWGSLFNGSARELRIHRLNPATKAWVDTGVVIDGRDRSRSDTLWDGSKLYVATSGTAELDPNLSARILRYSYDPAGKTYTLDSGFPVTISDGGMQAIVIAKDTTGVIWATYTQANTLTMTSEVMITHTTDDDLTWVTPYLLPEDNSNNLVPGEDVPGQDAGDVADIVNYNGKIGVMWSNQTPGLEAFRFATHVDGQSDMAWDSAVVHEGAKESDNHINLKGLTGDPAGQVFAAVKTSRIEPGAVLYYVMVLNNSNGWDKYEFGLTEDEHTRGSVVLDPQNRKIYAMATSPCCNGGAIYYKASSLDAIAFGPGIGTPLIRSTSSTKITDPTTTAQPISSASGFVALAADNTSNTYFHSALALRPSCGGRLATFVGSSGPDLLRGSKRADVIVGLGGRDKIFGGRGADTICGGLGRDRLAGGAGRDLLIGGPNRDVCIGGAGIDTFRRC